MLGGGHIADVTKFTPKGIVSSLGSANPSTLVYCQKNAIVTVNVEGGMFLEIYIKSELVLF